MVDDGRRDMKGDEGMVPCGVARERRRRGTRVSFYPRLITSHNHLKSPFGGPHIHMQYSTHRLYLLKRKKKETASCLHGDLHKAHARGTSSHSHPLLIIFSSFSSFSSFSLPSPLVVFLLMFLPSPPRELICKY